MKSAGTNLKDYQSYKLTKRSLSTASSSSTQNENSIFEILNSQVNNANHTSNPPVNSHANEAKFIHMAQSSG